MKPLMALCVVVPLVVMSGCLPAASHGGRIAFEKAIITVPEGADFGFAGRWRSTPDPIWGDPHDPNNRDLLGEPIVITRADDGTYSFVEVEGGGDLKCTCRALSLSDPGFVLVEIEARPTEEDKVPEGQPKQIRFFVVANRQGNDLFFQHLYAEDLQDWMAVEGYMIEIAPPGYLFSIVDAEPAELLDCVQKHWRELAHEPTSHWIREEP